MIRRTIRTGLFSVAALAMMASLALAQNQTSKPFAGGKVNGGTVTHSTKDGKDVLTLSDDFKVPDTPDPHWQVVDSKGNTYCCSVSARRASAASQKIGSTCRSRCRPTSRTSPRCRSTARGQKRCSAKRHSARR